MKSEDINSMIFAIKVQKNTSRVVEHETKLNSTQLIRVSDLKSFVNEFIDRNEAERNIN